MAKILQATLINGWQPICGRDEQASNRDCRESIDAGDRTSACRHSVAAGLLAEVLLDEAVELILDAEPAVKMAHIVISYNSIPLASHGTEPKSSGRPLLVGAGPNTRTPSPLENFAGQQRHGGS